MTRSETLASLRRSETLFYRAGHLASADAANHFAGIVINERRLSPEIIQYAAQLEQRAERFSV